MKQTDVGVLMNVDYQLVHNNPANGEDLKICLLYTSDAADE